MMTACFTQSFILRGEAHLKSFSEDEELTRLRAEAGAIVETGTFTPITDEAFINYPTVNFEVKGGKDARKHVTLGSARNY